MTLILSSFTLNMIDDYASVSGNNLSNYFYDNPKAFLILYCKDLNDYFWRSRYIQHIETKLLVIDLL